ncbi:hypothetical protein [Mycobacterium conspicuum]|uniref:hypothetical protein n=1 Tax=Mycobacterium conspicuum TaxID=44010 RepID=UPI00111C5EEB|nr:hypothetical protein [Mycobacterium conspicuum]
MLSGFGNRKGRRIHRDVAVGSALGIDGPEGGECLALPAHPRTLMCAGKNLAPNDLVTRRHQARRRKDAGDVFGGDGVARDPVADVGADPQGTAAPKYRTALSHNESAHLDRNANGESSRRLAETNAAMLCGPVREFAIFDGAFARAKLRFLENYARVFHERGAMAGIDREAVKV